MSKSGQLSHHGQIGRVKSRRLGRLGVRVGVVMFRYDNVYILLMNKKGGLNYNFKTTVTNTTELRTTN